jgi:hypothetical protein
MARKYRRDNKGRFAGGGGGATARGGRLKTAAGNKRKTQMMKAGGAKAAGTIGKPKGLKPGAIKAKSQVSSARQAATDRLRIKTQTRRKLRADRASVIPVTSAGPKTIKTARPRSTVAKQRTKGNTQAQVASRVQRKAAANKANLAAITRAERTGAAQGRQYERALKRGMTLERAQNFLQTGKLPGRDNSIAAQRITKQARDRLAAKNATRAAGAKPTTQKERWAARSAMLSNAAAKNEAKAKRMFDATAKTDTAFNTQPGRLPGRARMNAQTERSFQLQEKATQQRSRAANLERMANTNKGDAAKGRAKRADTVKASYQGLKKGDTVEGILYGKREVVKVNAKSVTVKGGTKNFTIPWESIKPKG